MFHGLLPDSKVKGTVGRVRHMSHSGQRRGGSRKTVGGVLATFVKDMEKEAARRQKAAARVSKPKPRRRNTKKKVVVAS
jgi:hypothetical protein